jgi:hypothetical protein
MTCLLPLQLCETLDPSLKESHFAWGDAAFLQDLLRANRVSFCARNDFRGFIGKKKFRRESLGGISVFSSRTSLKPPIIPDDGIAIKATLYDAIAIKATLCASFPFCVVFKVGVLKKS